MTDTDLGWTDEHDADLRRRLRAAAERDPVDEAWDAIIRRVEARRPRPGLRRRTVAAVAAGAVLVTGLLALRERADDDRVDTVDGTTTTSTTSTTDPEASTSTTVTPAGAPGGDADGGGSSDDGAGPGGGSPSGPTGGTPSGPGTPTNTTSTTTTSSTTTVPQPSGLDCTLLEAGDHMRAGPGGSTPNDLRLHVAQVLNLAEQQLWEAAQTALDGDDAVIAAFVSGGWQAPYRLDLRIRTLQILDTAEPDVAAEANAALDADTIEALETFLRGQNCWPEG